MMFSRQHPGTRARSLSTLAGVALAGALSGPLSGAVLTVGLGGTHTSVQDAIDAAVALPGDDQIRIASGTYHELLVLDTSSDSLDISGGWRSAFNTRDDDPELTVIDGLALGTVVDFSCSNMASVALRGLTIQGGSDPEIGGFRANVEDCDLVLRDLVVRGNYSLYGISAVALGGLRSSSSLTLEGIRIEDNEASYGRTAAVYNWSRTPLQLTNISVRRNRGHGFLVRSAKFSPVELSDILVTANVGPSSTERCPYGSHLSLVGNFINARRLRLIDNVGLCNQLDFKDLPRVNFGDHGEASISDSLITGGSNVGLHTWVNGDSRFALRLTNITVSGNRTGMEILSRVDGITVLRNNIVTGNDSNVVELPFGSPASIHYYTNWIGSDPGFVDPARGNYRLRGDSSAINSGSTPSFGLSALDLDLYARVQGSAVDQGAYERRVIVGALPPEYACRASASGPRMAIPLTATSSGCKCFKDFALQGNRCVLSLDGLQMSFSFPPPTPWEPLLGSWLLESSGLEGAFHLESWLDTNEGVFQSAESVGELWNETATEELIEIEPLGEQQHGIFRTLLTIKDPETGQSDQIEVEVDLFSQ